MKSQSNISLNWSGNVKANPKIIYPKNIDELKKATNEKNFIFAGNQRSFGDNSINTNLIISMKNFTKVIKFDKINGNLEVESGVLLKDILTLIVSEGWCIPVTPGSKYVSIGGMIANNVHGKNISNNQIKHYVQSVRILTTKNEIINCSSKENKKYFDITIGGFGLSGCILTATIKLKKINSVLMDQEIKEFTNYEEFFNLIKNTRNYEYNVNWIDTFGNESFKGLCYYGKHSNINNEKSERLFFKEKKIGLLSFVILKIFTQNYYLIKFTKFIFRKLKKFFYSKNANFDEFFYPQDFYTNWNKIYGKEGFFQVQFLVKEYDFKVVMDKISKFFESEKAFSTFVIIKKFEETGKYLNFFGKGFSISMDIPINNKFLITKDFLNGIFKEFEIKINFSKDYICNKNIIKDKKEYSDFINELDSINPDRKLNSMFSKRLKI
tara:strand:- start:2 stop:1315 length:1314 start_codon:yes stop_codon:yes gene_type:complete